MVTGRPEQDLLDFWDDFSSDTPVTWFWSTGDAWGTVDQGGGAFSLTVLGGRVALRRVVLTGGRSHELPGERTRTAGFRWQTP